MYGRHNVTVACRTPQPRTSQSNRRQRQILEEPICHIFLVKFNIKIGLENFTKGLLLLKFLATNGDRQSGFADAEDFELPSRTASKEIRAY
jgi:hypothetical protein